MPNAVPLSDREMEIVKRVAAQLEIPEEELVTSLIQAALARRVRKNTGKGPAKVYSLPRRRT